MSFYIMDFKKKYLKYKKKLFKLNNQLGGAFKNRINVPQNVNPPPASNDATTGAVGRDFRQNVIPEPERNRGLSSQNTTNYQTLPSMFANTGNTSTAQISPRYERDLSNISTRNNIEIDPIFLPNIDDIDGSGTNIPGHIVSPVQNIIMNYGNVDENNRSEAQIIVEQLYMKTERSIKFGSKKFSFSYLYCPLIWHSLTLAGVNNIPNEYQRINREKFGDVGISDEDFQEACLKLAELRGWKDYAIKVLREKINTEGIRDAQFEDPEIQRISARIKRELSDYMREERSPAPRRESDSGFLRSTGRTTDSNQNELRIGRMTDYSPPTARSGSDQDNSRRLRELRRGFIDNLTPTRSFETREQRLKRIDNMESQRERDQYMRDLN